MKTIIVAHDKHLGIGANNDLLWMGEMPADLQHFRETTSGAAVIMGYNTWKSIGHPLPGRQNIVITHRSEQIQGCCVVDSLQSAYESVEEGRETYIIGGGMIYASAIGSADRIIATEVDANFESATVYFPKIDKAVWRETQRIKHQADDKNRYGYDFVTYERI
jgi:dihydrofolate reductase